MKECNVCGKKMEDNEGSFKYFNDDGKELNVCGSCYLSLKRKDYKSGESLEDGSSE